MEKHLRLSQAAQLLGVSAKTLRTWENAGKINAIRTPGNQRRIPESEIRRLLGPAIPNDEPEIACAGDSKVIEELSMGGSGGNLPKWVLEDSSGVRFYAKGRSRQGAFEPEAEVCAYRLATLFGVPATRYELANLPELSDEPVCVCNDYSNGLKVMSLFRYVQGATGLNPANIQNGREKLDLVTSVLAEKDRTAHASILFMDYIVGNRDRHLRNFDVWIDSEGNMLGMVPMFDTGDSLFAAQPEVDILRACKAGNNFVQSKPYRNPHFVQVQLLQEAGYAPALNAVDKESIYRVINSCFSGNRAKYLGQFVRQNAERLGVLL